MIITTNGKNVYEQDDHYQSGAKKWSSFGLTNRTGSAGPELPLSIESTARGEVIIEQLFGQWRWL